MKVFISWSGSRSQAMADALRDWLPSVIQAVEPWTSSSDIDAGTRWTPALAEQLQQTQLGILCLTAENLNAPWLLFEAGALSKIFDKASVCPYLLSFEPTEVVGPLAQFQAVKADRDGTKRLLQTINRAQEHPLPEDRLNNILDVFWPSLEKLLLDITNRSQGTQEPKRSLENMVEEILRIVREQQQSLSNLVPIMDLSDAANEVNKELRKHNVEFPNAEIETRIKTLMVDFRMPKTEAISSLTSYLLKQANLNRFITKK
jgi:hypothetical protein